MSSSYYALPILVLGILIIILVLLICFYIQAVRGRNGETGASGEAGQQGLVGPAGPTGGSQVGPTGPPGTNSGLVVNITGPTGGQGPSGQGANALSANQTLQFQCQTQADVTATSGSYSLFILNPYGTIVTTPVLVNPAASSTIVVLTVTPVLLGLYTWVLVNNVVGSSLTSPLVNSVLAYRGGGNSDSSNLTVPLSRAAPGTSQESIYVVFDF